jgi:hypothetical protein
LETKEYFVYFEFSNCTVGAKDPLSAADDSFVGHSIKNLPQAGACGRQGI